MKKRILYTIIFLALTAIIAIQLLTNKKSAQQRIYNYDKDKTINVEVDTLKLEKPNIKDIFTGTFEPNKETKLSSEVQGKINDIFVEEGSYVKKGQILIQIDNSLLKLQLESVEIQIIGLEADVERYRILTDARAVQGVQLEKAELGLKSAKVQRKTILEHINKTTIVAPFDGVVTTKLTEVGSFAAPGKPLLNIIDISQMKFTVMVAENDLSLFHLNETYSIFVDAYPLDSFSGKASMIGSKANLGNSFPVQLNLENTPDLKIKSGMFGRLNVSHTTSCNVITIPSSAISGSTIQPQVYLIKDGRAYLHPVTISKHFHDKAVIKNGLHEGDVIVSSGFINLFDGVNVQIIKNR